jgi:hypothetical protein
MTLEEAIKICQDFANKHKIIFEDEGECGFGRECVGFMKGGWISYNPIRDDNYTIYPVGDNPDLLPPDNVTDAYHKYDCLAILGRGEKAIIQLAKWVKHLESKGNPKIVQYETGATGIQAMVTGVLNYAIILETN